MADNWISLRATDRIELEEVLEETILEVVHKTVREDLEIFYANLDRAGVNFAELEIPFQDELEDAILGHANRAHLAQAFLDALGLKGWEFLAPAMVDQVKRAVRFYAGFESSKLAEALSHVTLPPGPRLKRLRK